MQSKTADAPAQQRLCPKCGHRRTPLDPSPPWQCPVCGIAYAKYAGYRARIAAATKPREPDTGRAPVLWDGSLWSLLAANGLALIMAQAGAWDLAYLMLLYWVQSVVIGVANIARIRSLEKFSTRDFTINGQLVEPTVATKNWVANFFLVHYGLFHAAYLVFIVKSSAGVTLDPWLVVAVAGFVVNHIWSYRYNISLDRTGCPNIGTFMFLPYLRVVPMHLTILFGRQAAPDSAAWLFIVLKTLADIAMHLIAHAALQHSNVKPGTDHA